MKAFFQQEAVFVDKNAAMLVKIIINGDIGFRHCKTSYFIFVTIRRLIVILAGYINPNESLLAIYSDEKGDDKPQKYAQFKSSDYYYIEDLIKFFLQQANYTIDDMYAACFGLAGPVMQGECTLTHLKNWSTISIRGLRDSFGLVNVDIVNDMAAIGYAIPSLKEEEKISLNPNGIEKEGNGALIGAFGLGLGELLLFWDYDQFRPSPSEGGHTNFAPHDELSAGFFCDYLSKTKTGLPISPDQIISWEGLVHIYAFLESKGKEQKYEKLSVTDATEKAMNIIKNKKNSITRKLLTCYRHCSATATQHL